MAEPGRRDVLLGGTFAALAAGCWLATPRRVVARLAPGTLAAAVPTAFGGYRVVATDGLVLPPEDELSQRLYDTVLTRIYAAPGRPPVMALFAYGSTQNLTLELHRPDECYPMQGFAVTPPSPAPVAIAGIEVPAVLMSATRRDRVERILFWSRIGDRFPPDRWRETMLVARENLHGRMPDGMLVRLSVLGASAPAALAQLRTFAGLLGDALSPAGRRLMMGG